MANIRHFSSITEASEYNRKLQGGLTGSRLPIKETDAETGYFQLKPGFKTPVDVNVVKMINGLRTYGYITVQPGIKYDLEGDSMFTTSLKNDVVKKAYDENLKKQLEANGVEAKQERCNACGGRVTKLVYSPLEVVE